MWGAATRWLVLDGLVPLLGAAALFLIWGGIRRLTLEKSKFKYSWKEAVDPMGWLYGAAILSVQAGSASATSTSGGSSILTLFCYGAGATSLLLLLSSMTNRGEDATWKPPPSLTVVVALLVVVILFAGYKVHDVVELSGGAK